MNDSENSMREEQPSPAQPSQETAPTIDIKQLAERVYRLMQAELRLERERGVRGTGRHTR